MVPDAYNVRDLSFVDAPSPWIGSDIPKSSEDCVREMGTIVALSKRRLVESLQDSIKFNHRMLILGPIVMVAGVIGFCIEVLAAIVSWPYSGLPIFIAFAWVGIVAIWVCMWVRALHGYNLSKKELDELNEKR